MGAVDFTAWLSETNDLIGTPLDRESERAAAAWRRIQDRPTSVTFLKPDGTTLGAQTVRIEWNNRSSEIVSPAGTAALNRPVIFGVRNHPDGSIADSDIAKGYRFVLNNREFRCLDPIYPLGEVQCEFESVG